MDSVFQLNQPVPDSRLLNTYSKEWKAQWYHTKKATVDGVVREALFEVVIFEQKLQYIEKE